ncbi:RNA polymerase sigma factor [Tessaracoccus palaemonis]|uniref:RNA polymerase sigma factor n=1 Tax=Tessaracoccus palaemonis TaxID=2829499 RepID=UPI002102631B|nr:RNA polymerase sigma factor [Tessaracoccus palaemonis]
MSAELRAALRLNADDLLAYFERRVDPRDDAADLLAETMLQAWRRLADAPAEATPLRMWLFGIARNVLANQRRGRRRRLALAAKLRSQFTVPITASPEDAVTVRAAIDNLGPDQRDLVTLVHWDGFTVAEAAEVLGVNPSTARSRYAAAKQQLREALQPAESLCG